MAKLTITLPDDLLDHLDREVERRRTSRSALLQEAMRRELGWSDPAAVDAAVARARAALAGAEAFESSDLVRVQRDIRTARAN